MPLPQMAEICQAIFAGLPARSKDGGVLMIFARNAFASGPGKA